MTRHLFGWNYPPGCSGPPEPPEYCDMCGTGNLDNCICPECPQCGAVGDPICYREHGLQQSIKQYVARSNALELERVANLAAEKFWSQYEA